MRQTGFEMMQGAAPLTIDECVENVLPILLHQVVDVPENATATVLAAATVPNLNGIHGHPTT